VPDIAAIPPKTAELDIVSVGPAPGLERENELVPAAVERTHSTVVFHPHAYVKYLGVDRATGREQFRQVPPVNANVKKSTTNAKGSLIAQAPLKKDCETR
jgi:hypothetical protein